MAFSFKALVGSLVLSLGVDDMWTVIGVLLTELMLLTPSEVREFSDISPVAKYCKPGTKEGKLKSLKYSILD